MLPCSRAPVSTRLLSSTADPAPDWAARVIAMILCRCRRCYCLYLRAAPQEPPPHRPPLSDLRSGSYGHLALFSSVPYGGSLRRRTGPRLPSWPRLAASRDLRALRRAPAQPELLRLLPAAGHIVSPRGTGGKVRPLPSGRRERVDLS